MGQDYADIRGAPDALVAESIRGLIEVTGTPGWVRLKKDSGVVRLSDVNARDISVSTVIGPVTGSVGVQRVHLETMTGAITTSQVLVPVSMTDIDTHDGDVRSVGLKPRVSARLRGYRCGCTMSGVRFGTAALLIKFCGRRVREARSRSGQGTLRR